MYLYVDKSNNYLDLSFNFTFEPKFEMNVQIQKNKMKSFLIILTIAFNIVINGQATLESKSVSNNDSPADLNVDQLDSFVNVYFQKRAGFINKLSKEISETEQEELDKIVQDIKNVSPKSSDYYYIEYVNQGKTIAAFDFLKKADAAYPNNVEYYDDFMYHYELTNEQNLRSNYSKKLASSNTIHESLMEYNYNVLMSLKPNAILITNGSDDTFPLFILQDVQKVRTDVTVINIDMLSESKYIETKAHALNLDIKKQKSTVKTAEYLIENNSSKNIYLGHTVNQELLTKYQINLYLSGLTYQYSKNPVNNVANAVYNFENSFKLEQLQRLTTNKKINQINFNYILPLFTFLEYYKGNSETEKYKKTRELILLIAQRADKEKFILEYLSLHNL